MKNLMVFNYTGKEVRTVFENNEPLFVAKDICDILEIKQPTQAVEGLDNDEKLTCTIYTSGQNREVLMVNESGLYSLVFKSRKPEAKQFKKWVTSEVLPSIRKHGMYATDETLEQMIMSPDFGIKLLTTIKEEREQRKLLEAKVEEDAPKVAFHNQVVAAEGDLDMDATAKLLGTGRNLLFKFLRDKKVLRSNNEPYQAYIDQGYFKVKENVYQPNKQNDLRCVYVKTVVTPKGQTFINKLMDRCNYKKNA